MQLQLLPLVLARLTRDEAALPGLGRAHGVLPEGEAYQVPRRFTGEVFFRSSGLRVFFSLQFHLLVSSQFLSVAQTCS